MYEKMGILHKISSKPHMNIVLTYFIGIQNLGKFKKKKKFKEILVIFTNI